MANKKSNKKNRVLPTKPKAEEPYIVGGGWHATRETIESVVIAFVLAFLFRTFEAEAFVIPTGSMSPSLQGLHKDVECSECGYRFRANASSEGDDRQLAIARREPAFRIDSHDVITGQCPMCRQTMLMRRDVPGDVPDYIDTDHVENHRSYNGDRILVNKYAYTNNDPDRWDVVVFKFPGNGEMNYIKRLVGLPNETLRIKHGDLFIRSDSGDGQFHIERKPADKVHAMLQPVHDTNYDPATLYQAGWPLRWEAADTDGWQIEATVDGQTVQQNYQFESAEATESADTQWLRYRNYMPQNEDWSVARAFKDNGNYGRTTKQQWLDSIEPELIRDYNSYNSSRIRGGGRFGNRGPGDGILDLGWDNTVERYNLHWVGDLAVACDVDVEQASGELELDLVEAGKHFYCRINLQTGEAQAGVRGTDGFTAKTSTSLRAAGSYELLFANVDDQLLLWVDGELVRWDDGAEGVAYDADTVFGGRDNAVPQTSEQDPADLAPVGIGARGASLEVTRLQVLRDIYYIAVNDKDPSNMCDYTYPLAPFRWEGQSYPALRDVRQLFVNPDNWVRFRDRRSVQFPVDQGQLFVMGDNSPASQDCRLWTRSNDPNSVPGGPYLDRRLLIGKAICVFWPHSWGEIPGASKLPGFPNFGDMRLVR